MAYVPYASLTVAQLRFRIDWHLSLADMFLKREEPSMAREFRDLANTYADELERRGECVS